MTLKNEICGRCGKQVYHAEKKVAINKVWHQFCFNCVLCHKSLNPSNFSTHKGEIFCQQCYFNSSSFEMGNKKSSGSPSSSKHSGLSSQSKDQNSSSKHSDIIESSNVRPSEIKSTIRKRRKDKVEAKPSEDSIPRQFYNRKRRNAICGQKGSCQVSSKTSLKKEESQEIICETTHSTFPRRSSKNKSSKDDLLQTATSKSKRRKNISAEDQEDSAYETEHHTSPKKGLYKKILPAFLCKCDDSKISSPKNEAGDSKNKPPKKQNVEEIKGTLKTDSEKKHNPAQSPKSPKEEILFVSESGTTKIVKYTSPKQIEKGSNKNSNKSKTEKEDTKEESLKKLKKLNKNKTSDSYICEDKTCTIKDTSKKMKKVTSQEKSNESLYKSATKDKKTTNACDKSACNTFNKMKKHESEDSLNKTAHKPKKHKLKNEEPDLKRIRGEEKLQTIVDSSQRKKKNKEEDKKKSDESLYKPTTKDKSKKEQKDNKEDINSCNKTTCGNKKLKKHDKSDESLNKKKVKKIKSQDSLNKSSGSNISEDTTCTIKDSSLKLKKLKDQDTTGKNSPNKMKNTKKADQNKSDKSSHKPVVKDKDSSEKLKKGKPCNASTCAVDSKKKKHTISDESLSKTKDKENPKKLKKGKFDSNEPLPEIPQKKTVFNKFWKHTKEDTQNKSSAKSDKKDKKTLKHPSDESMQPQEKRSSMKKTTSNHKTKSQISFEDTSKSKKRSKSTKKKPETAISSKQKDDLRKQCSDCNNKCSKLKKKQMDKNDSASLISSDHASLKFKSDKKTVNQKKKEDTTLDKSKKDKQNKSKSKNEEMSKTPKKQADEDSFNPLLHSTMIGKKKLKNKGDDYASVDDFFKPIQYSGPKGDQIARKKKHEDDTKEDLYKTANNTKESSKKHKEADKSKEKPDKHKKEETPEKKKGCKNPNCKNKSSKNNNSKEDEDTLYKTATSSPKKGFFNFSSKKEDSHQTAGGALEETKHQSSKNKTKHFEETKNISLNKSSREKKTQKSKPDDLGSSEDLVQPMKHSKPKLEKKKRDRLPEDNISEEELYTTAYNYYPFLYNRNIKSQIAKPVTKSSKRRNNSRNEETPYHTALKYPLSHNKEDLFQKLRSPKQKLTFEDQIVEEKHCCKQPRCTTSPEKSSKIVYDQKKQKPHTTNSPIRRKLNFDEEEPNKKAKNDPKRQSSGECKITNNESQDSQPKQEKRNEESFCVTAEISPKTNKLNKPQRNRRNTQNKISKTAPQNKNNVEDIFKCSFVKSILENNKEENRETLLQKLRKKLFYHCQKRTDVFKKKIVRRSYSKQDTKDLKKKIVRCEKSMAKKSMIKRSKEIVSESSEASSNQRLGGGNGLYNRAKVVERFYERCLPIEHEEFKKEYCRRCSRKVYIVERKFASNGIFHKRCFSCYICQRRLDSLNVVPRKGEIFCKQCYMKYYGPHTYGYGMCPNLHFN